MIVAAACLAALGSTPAAAQGAQSAQQAPSISQGNCFANFNLETYANSANPMIKSDDNLYFVPGLLISAPPFCQARTTPGGNIVEIFTTDHTNRCLALNATTGAIYLHSANGCTSDTSTYAQWHFIPKGIDEFTDNPMYAIQNQYAPAGDPCLYDNIQTDPAITNTCSVDNHDSFEWFQYMQD